VPDFSHVPSRHPAFQDAQQKSRWRRVPLCTAHRHDLQRGGVVLRHCSRAGGG